MEEGRTDSAMLGALMLVTGLLLGASAALLFAPQSGKETRKDILRYARKAKGRAEGVVEEFSDSVTEMVESVGEKAEEILEKGKDLATDAKKGLLYAMEEGQKRLEKQRSRLEKLIA
ncbi:MAG: YtxH domain-containing protein [Deltaproteobacteria bacterium]|nr:YtxH domain-containing protein [Deltaproteobacteria bacterium]